RNVILVAPTLGPRSEAGALMRPGGVKGYLDHVMAALAQHTPLWGGRPPAVGNLILAAHSGGGAPMLELANQGHGFPSPEVWAFDSMYQSAEPWATWKRAHPSSKIFTYYTKVRFSNGKWHLTYLNSTALEAKGLPNVTAQQASVGHNQVPIT